jgi:hypothetical protein
MKSYIKIIGPPHVSALKELEKLSVDMPEVCIMDTFFSSSIPPSLAEDVGGRRVEAPRTIWVGNYFRSQGVEITKERCQNIISESGEMLGEYDFYFEWFQEPSMGQLEDLIGRIDEALKPLGCLYKIVTKK